MYILEYVNHIYGFSIKIGTYKHIGGLQVVMVGVCSEELLYI